MASKSVSVKYVSFQQYSRTRLSYPANKKIRRFQIWANYYSLVEILKGTNASNWSKIVCKNNKISVVELKTLMTLMMKRQKR